MGKTMLLKADELKKRRIGIIIFLACVFIFITLWAYIQPLNASPDEVMRYDIVKYMLDHGCLPDGRAPDIRNEIWGISYAFYPILSYMIMFIPAKIVSFFTTEAMAVIIASRLVNAVFGTITAYLTFRISEMLFKGKAKILFTALVTFLPGLIFVQSYINNDAMAVLSSAWIIYVWVRSLKEGWTKGLCVHLAFAISMCALSYYNAYGLILCSIIFFFTTIIIGNKAENKTKYVMSRTMLIVILVLALVGWWFIRNYILYGDLTGWNVTTQYAEMYAQDGFKPSQRDNLAQNGIGIMGLLRYPVGPGISWARRVAESFVGTFGFLNIFIPSKLVFVYFIVYAIGAIGVITCLISVFRLTVKKDSIRTFNKKGMFNWSMLIVIIITFGLLLYYNLYSDLQAQGRYLLPMVIPFMYFVTLGIERLLNLFVKNEKARNVVYIVLSVFFAVSAVVIYLTVFRPVYVA